MERYLLWRIDSDGIPELIGRFSTKATAMMFACILRGRDEYRSCTFCVEEF